MSPIYIKMLGTDKQTVEATASRYDDSRDILPDGQWRIIGSGEVMYVDDMPDHWIEQIRAMQTFGKTL